MKKRDLVELMQWQLNIVDRQHGKWYLTREFKDFVDNNTEEVLYVLRAFVKSGPPGTMSGPLGPMLALLIAWDPSLSEEEALEAAVFLEYWTAFGVCPFDRYGSGYGSEPVRVV